MVHIKRLGLALALAGCLPLLSATNAAAAELDLSAGSTAATCTHVATIYCSFQGALWSTTDSQSTGTGVIQPFVRLNDNDALETGMNTSARPLPQDENNSPNFTRDLPIASVPIVTIAGNQYYEFLLDINQINSGDNKFISLQGFELCSSATPNRTIGATTTDCAGTDVYSLDNTADTPDATTSIKLNFDLNPGSGAGDLFAYIPVGSGIPAGSFVYLWSQFGATPWGNNDGFEEWAVRTPTTIPTPVIPEPASMLLLGSGLAGLGSYARRLRQRKAQK